MKRNFLDYAFVGDESYGQDTLNNEYLISDEPTWVVDPLDGTVSGINLIYPMCGQRSAS